MNRLRAVVASFLLIPSLVCAFEIESWRTPEGVRVYYVGQQDLPMFDLRVVFDAGSARDGDNYGLANMTVRMLEQGAAGLDKERLALEFDRTGAQFGGSASKDKSIISLRVLSDPDYSKPALDLFTKVITAPDFPEDDLKRLINEEMTSIKKRKERISTFAAAQYNKIAYGQHPYAHPVNGEEETVARLTTDQLEAFYKRYYVTGNAVITLVGQLTRAQAERTASYIAKRLRKGDLPPPIPPVPPARAKVVNIPFDSKQAHVFIGQPALRVGSEAFFPLYIANNIFGGSGFSSRLLQELRVKHGYVYSSWSYFSPKRQKGLFTIGFQTESAKAKDATELAVTMLKQLYQEGVDDKELALAKQSIERGFPLKMGDNKKIAGWLDFIGLYGLADDYLDRYIASMNAVDQAAIIKALHSHIDPQNLVIVTVGG